MVEVTGYHNQIVHIIPQTAHIGLIPLIICCRSIVMEIHPYGFISVLCILKHRILNIHHGFINVQIVIVDNIAVAVKFIPAGRHRARRVKIIRLTRYVHQLILSHKSLLVKPVPDTAYLLPAGHLLAPLIVIPAVCIIPLPAVFSRCHNRHGRSCQY